MTSFFLLLCTECSFGTQSHGRLAAGQGVGEEPHQSPAAPQGGPASALLGLPLRQPAASRRRDLRHMRVRPECGGMQGESVCSWQVLTPYNSVFSGRGESIGFSRTLEGDVQIPDHSRSKISPARLCGAFLLFPALCHWASLKACCWENYHRALSGDWLACRRMTDCKQHCIFMVFAVRRSQNWDLVLLLPPLVCVSSIFFFGEGHSSGAVSRCSLHDWLIWHSGSCVLLIALPRRITLSMVLPTLCGQSQSPVPCRVVGLLSVAQRASPRCDQHVVSWLVSAV